MVVSEVVAETTPKVDSIDDYFLKRDKITLDTKMKMLVWSKEGLGKTYLALSCKPPIYVICTEPKRVAPLLVHFPDKDIRIMECSVPYSDAPIRKKTGKEDKSVIVNDPEASLRMVEKATELLRDVTEGTIVIDSVSDIWDYFVAWIEYNAEVYTQSGTMMRTEWGKVNSKYRNLIDRLMSRPVDFIMTARSQNAYDGPNETSRQVMSAQKKTPYIPHIIIELVQKPKTVAGKTKMITTGIVRKGRGLNESAVGVQIERPTYDKIKVALKDHGGDAMFQ